jgi:hypothetical protein
MVEELVFKDEAAAEYDRAFAHVTAHFMPFLSLGSCACKHSRGPWRAFRITERFTLLWTEPTANARQMSCHHHQMIALLQSPYAPELFL